MARMGGDEQEGNSNQFPDPEHGNTAQPSSTNATQTKAIKVNTQGRSLLFRMPQEIRDYIFSDVFFSTRFAFGGDKTYWHAKQIETKPAPNGLALLRTCRRAKFEIGGSWLGQVLFVFNNPMTMLDKLSALPIDTLSQVRHVRVSGDTVPIFSSNDGDRLYRLASILKLLPGLRLDELTVLRGADLNLLSYDTLRGLIQDSDGWKTLRYISHSSALLGFYWESAYWPEDPEDRRKPQPKQWQGLLENRDGHVTNPSVTVYRATQPRQYGAILDPKRRIRYEQQEVPETPSLEYPSNIMIREDSELMAENEKDKEMMIVVKRGSGVEYEEKKGSPSLDRDLRTKWPGTTTWAEVRDVCFDILYGREDYEVYDDVGSGRDDEVKSDVDFDDENGCFPERVDIYKDVDEYSWTGRHFTILDDMEEILSW